MSNLVEEDPGRQRSPGGWSATATVFMGFAIVILLSWTKYIHTTHNRWAYQHILTAERWNRFGITAQFLQYIPFIRFFKLGRPPAREIVNAHVLATTRGIGAFRRSSELRITTIEKETMPGWLLLEDILGKDSMSTALNYSAHETPLTYE